jgi:hypothetical protein
MKTTKRFEDAVTKLYTAFHKGELDAMDCKHCAVGNMCDNNSNWINLEKFGFGVESRICNQFNNSTGYSKKELATIEYMFIYGGSSLKFDNTISKYEVSEGYKTKQEQKELQFKGLCAVVEYLCELDNIPNVMEFTSLFDTENNKAINQLQFN